MKIKMLRTENGSIDGVTVKTYAEGEEYDLSATDGARDLARVFVGEKWAEEVPGEEKAMESTAAALESPENKAAEAEEGTAAAAPENKAVQPASNKRKG